MKRLTNRIIFIATSGQHRQFMYLSAWPGVFGGRHLLLIQRRELRVWNFQLILLSLQIIRPHRTLSQTQWDEELVK
jgi:hypothetical protein